MSKENSFDRINPGHYFELLDRTHIALLHLEMALGDHPVLDKHPQLKEIYEQAVERLAALYQAIGQLEETWKP
jgi:hypothetical protein